MVHQLGVTLEEMYNGGVRKLGLQKNVICEKCEGRHSFIHQMIGSLEAIRKTKCPNKTHLFFSARLRR